MKDRFQAKPVNQMSLPYMFSHMVRAFLNWRVDQTEHYSPALAKGMINY